MLDDIFKSLQSHVNERLSSPLMGSFVVSWCLWNYKFLVILFSAATVSQTFTLIDTLVFPDKSSLLLRGVLFPALTAAAYIFVYPYPAKLVYEFTRNRQKEINDIRRRIEDETPLTLEESRKLRQEARKIEIENSDQIARKDREIERLKDEADQMEAEINSLRSTQTETSKKTALENDTKVEATQLNMLRLIENGGGSAAELELVNASNESQTKTLYDLGELTSMEYIARNYSQSAEDYIYELTHKGRKYLLAHRDEPRLPLKET